MINSYCNNDELKLIFERTSFYDIVFTIPCVCKRWYVLSQSTKLNLPIIRGWYFLVPNRVISCNISNSTVISSNGVNQSLQLAHINEVYFVHNDIKSGISASYENNTIIIGRFLAEYFVIKYTSVTTKLRDHPSNKEHRTVYVHKNLQKLLLKVCEDGGGDELKQQLKQYCEKLSNGNHNNKRSIKWKPYRK